MTNEKKEPKLIEGKPTTTMTNKFSIINVFTWDDFHGALNTLQGLEKEWAITQIVIQPGRVMASATKLPKEVTTEKAG